MFVIKNGTVITADHTMNADILVDAEKIIEIGKDLRFPEDISIVDATGMLVMPGGVDVHTHFDLPMFGTVSSDDHYTGHKAAAFGGTTTVIDFVSLDTPSLISSIDAWHAKADFKAAVDFSFHMNITRLNEQIQKEIRFLPSEGITSIKVFTAYNNRLRLNDGDIFRVLRLARENSILTMLHAENGDVIEIMVAEALRNGHVTPDWHARTRPAWGATESVLKAVSLAAQAEAPLYIVHMNTAGEVAMLEYGRSKGVQVIGETCPHYLLLTEDLMSHRDGSKYLCSPPLRQGADNIALWQGIQNGIISVVGTDHCPFFYDGTNPIIYEGQPISIPGKELGSADFTKIPNGLPGVGDRLPVMWTSGVLNGRITPNQFVALHATNPAKYFGLFPKKGTLQPGSDADMLIWDPDIHVKYGRHIAQHRTDYNLYEGWNLTGFPRKVFLRGNMIVNEGKWYGKKGMGSFIKRSLFQP